MRLEIHAEYKHDIVFGEIQYIRTFATSFRFRNSASR